MELDLLEIQSVQLSIDSLGFPAVEPDSFSSSSLSSPAAAPAERPEFETSVDLNTALSAVSSAGLLFFARVESFGGRLLPRLTTPVLGFGAGCGMSLSNRSGSPPAAIEATALAAFRCLSMNGTNLALGNQVELGALGLLLPDCAVAKALLTEADPAPTARELPEGWLDRPVSPTTPTPFAAGPLFAPFMKLFN